MRLTTRTNLAMRILMFCGVNQDKVATKGEIARVCHARETHIAQVVNVLAQKGYLATTRGRGARRRAQGRRAPVLREQGRREAREPS